MASGMFLFVLCVMPLALAWPGAEEFQGWGKGQFQGWGKGQFQGWGKGQFRGWGKGEGRGDGNGYGKLAQALMHKADHDMESWNMHKLPSPLTWFKLKKMMEDHQEAFSKQWEAATDLHDKYHDAQDFHAMHHYLSPWVKPVPSFWAGLQRKYDAVKQWHEDHMDALRQDAMNRDAMHQAALGVHYHDAMHRLADAKEDYAKFEQFKKYVSTWQEHVDKMQSVKKMGMMMKMHAQAHKEQEFSQMMKSFVQKKKQYVFTVLYELMKFCKCKESMKNLDKYFNPSEDSMTMGGNNNTDIMDIDEQLGFVHPLSKEDAKKMFMKGLMTTLCLSAKGYVQHVRMVAAQHLALHYGLGSLDNMGNMGKDSGKDMDNGMGNGMGNNMDNMNNNQVPNNNNNQADNNGNNGNFNNNNIGNRQAQDNTGSNTNNGQMGNNRNFNFGGSQTMNI